MRPLYLKMTAFGSYAETTELPFEDLRESLYLVTGDTGAGKTTIFDAIMFALYGVASGSERSADMLHCDHVPKSTDTAVTLRFAQGGREYTVERSLHFIKKRGAAEQYGDAKPDALLREPEGDPVRGATRVTDRIVELLGLNAEQFRKIIMLAQGEFREFLKANSDKKNEILGKLFDSSPYLWYQNLLAGARDELKARRAARSEDLRVLMQTVFLPPEGLTPEERERFLPAHPELVENLRRLAEEDRAALNSLEAARGELSVGLAALNTKKGAAEADNAQLDSLAAQEERLAALTRQGPEMAARQRAWSRAETAVHRVKPAMDRLSDARRILAETLGETEKLRAQLAAYQLEARKAQEDAAADAQTGEELAVIAARLQEIGRQLPRYEELAQTERKMSAALASEAAARKAQEEERKKLETVAAQLTALRERLLALEDADAQAQQAGRLDEKAQERLRELGAAQKERTEILRLQSALKEQEERYLRLHEDAIRKSDSYNALYHRFLSGQAGLLTGELRKRLESEGEAECPVCRSRLGREQLPKLAAAPEETPDREAVDRAKADLEKAERARSRQETDAATLKAAIEERKTALLDRVFPLLPDCAGWETLCAGDYLAAAVREAEQARRETQQALIEAERLQAERRRGRESLPAKEARQKELQEKIDALEQTALERRGEAQRAEAVIGELKKQLRHPDAEAAKAEKRALEEKQTALSKLIQAHRDALDRAKQRLDTAQGTLQEKERAAEKQRTEQDEAHARLERTLAETGFENSEAARLALAPIGDRDAEEWLRAEQRAFTAHEEALRLTREQLQKLAAQTAGKRYTALSELDERIAALTEEFAAANGACAERESLLKNHENVLSRARTLRLELSRSEGAWTRLDKLASLAAGVSGEGGKLSFDRYVMGAVFREILEMANRRLELMSGGRYELVHKVNADHKSAKAGLEIEVLDNSTGLQRGSGSLSGGEAFFTSLSLALGLSDVVQNHAGGKQMDALFIDEGFGTLSDDVLGKALEVLGQLTADRRLVGVISHVDKLDESIPQKIRVRAGEKGSRLSLELT